jgi:hypothetical protein
VPLNIHPNSSADPAQAAWICAAANKRMAVAEIACARWAERKTSPMPGGGDRARHGIADAAAAVARGKSTTKQYEGRHGAAGVRGADLRLPGRTVLGQDRLDFLERALDK